MSTPSAPTSAPAGAAPPAPPPPKSGHGGAIAAVIVLIVVILLIVGLGFANVIPGFHLGTSSKNSGPPAKSYNVTFGQAGVPSGTTWSATLGGNTLSSTGASIVFAVTNGTYAYTVSAAGYETIPSSAASGSLTVRGAALAVAFTFEALPVGTYTVTFSESGLPTGTTWSVTLNGTPSSGAGATLVFSSTNGSLAYTVGAVAGYTATPSSGTVTVAGANTGVSIAFSSSSSSGGQTSFSQAEAVADTAAAGEGGGGWTLVDALGISSTSAISNSTGNSSCPVTGGTGTLTVPSWTGSYSNGYQTVWAFDFYKNVSGVTSLLLLTTQGSSATVIGTESGVCSEGFDYESVPSTTIDSPAVASAISSADSAYLAAHATANSLFLVFPTFSIDGFNETGFWIVAFSTCGLYSEGGTGANFTAEVNASSGAVIASAYSNGTCVGVDFGPHMGEVPASASAVPAAAARRGE